MIYLITGNKGKLEEVKEILGSNKVEQLEIDLPEIQEIDAYKIIQAKLEAAKEEIRKQVQDNEEFVNAEFIIEDTSLYLDALNGLPGPLIKWFLRTVGVEGLVNISKKLGNTQAKAKNLLGYSDANGEIQFFEGAIAGKIVPPKGEFGFGWDPIFQPNGYNKTFAEMTKQEKSEISHRRIALEKFKKYLER